jgi:cell division protein FtsL
MTKSELNRRSGDERRTEIAKKIIDTENTANRVSRLVVFCLVSVMMLVVYVLVTEHDGRQSVVNAARIGCERDKQDRIAAVILNEDIVGIFHEAEGRAPTIVSPARDRLLSHIQTTNNGLKFRARENCVKRYPAASWFP